jgi:hypothetical protein
MPAILKALLPVAACAALLPAVSGCAPDPDQFPPACPRVAFFAPTADLALYRPGSKAGDLTALMLTGRMQAVGGKCAAGKKGTVEADVSAEVALMRGPAMPGNQASVPVFVAVLEGERILDKRVYTLTGTFPSNVDQITVATPPVHMVLPVSRTKSAAAYEILTGFQLTPAQVRQHEQKPGP